FKDIGIKLSYGENVLVAVGFGILVTIIGTYLLSKVERDESKEEDNRFYNVEKVFAVLMIFTACSMAFAHGSNDVANAVGPLAAVVNVVNADGDIATKSTMPSWILLLGGAGIVFGLATYGFKVMGTIGRKITELTPSRGFAAELGAAATVVLASGTGLPISTTHTLVGAVLGVGMARGIGAINLRMVGSIFLSWVVTLPAGAGLSILFFFFFKGVFGV
ncbi:inorganic phosphate transporter, partial [Porticoccaceae bacterium]|nr:inorganic phosphate transporter [Porticoccaceae bacterium]